MSAGYYDQHGEAFFRRTVDLDMGAERARFVAHLLPGASILDAGCGSGRDALAFDRAGYAVTAFDASPEMVRLATEHTGLTVLHLSFEKMTWLEAFDGVWASASLLHVARAALPDAFGRVVAALRPGGVAYASFKLGEDEREVEGRRFTDMTERSLRALMEGAGLAVVDLWVSLDGRPAREGEQWVNSVGRRSA
jgi:SAM-dependent methyltransferase